MKFIYLFVLLSILIIPTKTTQGVSVWAIIKGVNPFRNYGIISKFIRSNPKEAENDAKVSGTQRVQTFINKLKGVVFKFSRMIIERYRVYTGKSPKNTENAVVISLPRRYPQVTVKEFQQIKLYIEGMKDSDDILSRTLVVVGNPSGTRAGELIGIEAGGFVGNGAVELVGNGANQLVEARPRGTYYDFNSYDEDDEDSLRFDINVLQSYSNAITNFLSANKGDGMKKKVYLAVKSKFF